MIRGELGLTLVEAIIVALILAVVLAIVIPLAMKAREDAIGGEAATQVYEAIRAAGNVYQINGAVPGTASPPGVVTGVVVFKMGRIGDGIAVLLTNNDAAFWVSGETVHVVNASAGDLLPDAPAAPENVTETDVIRVAK